MKINRLKIGQKVWIHNGEFPVQEEIVSIDKESNSVELTDGWDYSATEIHSTEAKCKTAN